MRSLLADIVLVLHFALAMFIVVGLAAIWLGGLLPWRWIRDFRFRIAHIATISFVALEGVLGITCPLTAWEDRLRQSAVGASFVARWLQRLLYYDLPEWVFAVVYVGMAIVTAVTWIYGPPQRDR